MSLNKAQSIRLIAFDIDGIMTDGGLYLTDSGEEFKRFNSLDGHGLRMLKASGVELAIITGRTSRCRATRTPPWHLALVSRRTRQACKPAKMLAQLKLPLDAVAFMGDDVMDLPVMLRVGFAISVPNAPQVVRDRAHYVTEREGGHGAVREACELLMSAQGTLDAQLAPYLT